MYNAAANQIGQLFNITIYYEGKSKLLLNYVAASQNSPLKIYGISNLAARYSSQSFDIAASQMQKFE
jgi:hypothetical protein